MYLRFWAYDVLPDDVDAFTEAYGEDGSWADLFKQGKGFLGTELLRDLGTPTRFLTIDRWESEAHWREFLAARSLDYAELGRRFEPLTGSQRELLDGTV